jgi:hypothetical protein
MPLFPFLEAILLGIKDIYSHHPFIFVFFAVSAVFTVASIILVIVAIGDPDNHPLRPTDEEGRVFLSPSFDSPYSPSNESVSPISEGLHTKFIPKNLERRVSEANVERLLAAHRDHERGSVSDDIWQERLFFNIDPRDTIQEVQEDESEDEDARAVPTEV